MWHHSQEEKKVKQRRIAPVQTGRLSYCSEFVGLGALWFGVRLAIANPANIKARCADRNSTSTPSVGGFTLRGHGACSVLFSASLIFLASTHFHFFGGGVARDERVLTSSQRAHIATFLAVLVSPKRSYEQKDEIAESRLHTEGAVCRVRKKKMHIHIQQFVHHFWILHKTAPKFWKKVETTMAQRKEDAPFRKDVLGERHRKNTCRISAKFSDLFWYSFSRFI